MLLPSYICLSPATVSHTLYLPAGCGISPCLNHGQTKCFGSVWSSCGQSGYVTAVRYTTWCSASLSNTHTASSALTGSETLKPTLHCIFACCCRSHWYTLPIQVFSLVIISILHPVCSHFIILIDPPLPMLLPRAWLRCEFNDKAPESNYVLRLASTDWSKLACGLPLVVMVSPVCVFTCVLSVISVGERSCCVRHLNGMWTCY